MCKFETLERTITIKIYFYYLVPPNHGYPVVRPSLSALIYLIVVLVFFLSEIKFQPFFSYLFLFVYCNYHLVSFWLLNFIIFLVVVVVTFSNDLTINLICLTQGLNLRKTIWLKCVLFSFKSMRSVKKVEIKLLRGSRIGLELRGPFIKIYICPKQSFSLVKSDSSGWNFSSPTPTPTPPPPLSLIQ